MANIILPCRGWENYIRITDSEYHQLKSLEKPVRQWMRDNGVPKDVGIVELKMSSAFPESRLEQDVYWVIGVWFLGPRHRVWATLFKLTWGGKVFTPADLSR